MGLADIFVGGGLDGVGPFVAGQGLRSDADRFVPAYAAAAALGCEPTLPGISQTVILTRTALILIGRVLGATDHAASRLYDPGHVHLLRPRRKA